MEFGKIFIQRVVPKQYRKMFIKLAIESVMSGNLAGGRLFKRYYQNYFGQGWQVTKRLTLVSHVLSPKLGIQERS